MLELSGVFGGACSFARSAAFSVSSTATRATNASTRASRAAFSAASTFSRAARVSARANNVERGTSVSTGDSATGVKDGATDGLTHIPHPGATEI